jgi:hypothetical protein
MSHLTLLYSESRSIRRVSLLLAAPCCAQLMLTPLPVSFRPGWLLTTGLGLQKAHILFQAHDLDPTGSGLVLVGRPELAVSTSR